MNEQHVTTDMSYRCLGSTVCYVGNALDLHGECHLFDHLRWTKMAEVC